MYSDGLLPPASTPESCSTNMDFVKLSSCFTVITILLYILHINFNKSWSSLNCNSSFSVCLGCMSTLTLHSTPTCERLCIQIISQIILYKFSQTKYWWFIKILHIILWTWENMINSKFLPIWAGRTNMAQEVLVGRKDIRRNISSSSFVSLNSDVALKTFHFMIWHCSTYSFQHKLHFWWETV